jgi:hypothetical protein
MKRLMIVALVLLFTLAPNARGTIDKKDCAPQQPLDLPAAYLLEGMCAEARCVLDALPDKLKHPPKGTCQGYSPEREMADRLALQFALADATLEPGRRDAFELLTDILERDSSVGTVLWQKLFARYAAREGYSSIGSFVLRRAGDSLEYQAADESSDKDEKAQAAAEREEVTRELARLEEGHPAAGAEEADPLAPVLQRLLESPRLAPFAESPLPCCIKPVTRAGRDEAAEESEDAARFAGFSFPDGFAPVRAERQKDEAVAIGVAQDYDPVGEISRGAYWVIRSHDGGKTWGRRLYTGLRVEAPYVVQPASDLHLLQGDQLAIEVSIRELDESSISFPPVALRAKREQDGLMLTIPFVDLERDSDRDGLTDLAEERLITDPANPDTDGDGLADADDPLPQVAWSGVMDDEASALAAVLENIAGMKPMGIIHGIGAPGAGVDDAMARMRRATLTDERTTFIVGERRAFRSLATSRRAVVLTRHELERARKKFGPMLPLELPLFVLDHERRRGCVIWDASWVGGSLALEKSGASWRVRTVGSWIT